MSVGPMGMAGSIAGTNLPQSKGSDVDRAQQENAAQSRETQGEKNAEAASGVGQTEEDQEATDRDADGRKLWEKLPGDGASDSPEGNADAEETEDSAKSKDPDGDRGANLDLSG